MIIVEANNASKLLAVETIVLLQVAICRIKLYLCRFKLIVN